MQEHNKILLTKIKSDLLYFTDEFEKYGSYDLEQLEYLIELIDFMLLEKVPVIKRTIKAFMEEIITTSIYSLKPTLLQTLKLVEQLEGEIEDVEI